MTATAPNLVSIENKLPKFAIGAKIRLMSGGPIMTVAQSTGTMVEAVWFEGANLMRAVFRNEMVQKRGGSDAKSR